MTAPFSKSISERTSGTLSTNGCEDSLLERTDTPLLKSLHLTKPRFMLFWNAPASARCQPHKGGYRRFFYLHLQTCWLDTHHSRTATLNLPKLQRGVPNIEKANTLGTAAYLLRLQPHHSSSHSSRAAYHSSDCNSSEGNQINGKPRQEEASGHCDRGTAEKYAFCNLVNKRCP